MTKNRSKAKDVEQSQEEPKQAESEQATPTTAAEQAEIERRNAAAAFQADQDSPAPVASLPAQVQKDEAHQTLTKSELLRELAKTQSPPMEKGIVRTAFYVKTEAVRMALQAWFGVSAKLVKENGTSLVFDIPEQTLIKKIEQLSQTPVIQNSN